MRPVGVSASGHVALCLGLRQAVKGRDCVRRAVSVQLGSTWVTPVNVSQLTCAPACMTDSCISQMTSTQITTASGLCTWRDNAYFNKPIAIMFHRYTFNCWCFYLFVVCVATVNMAPCAAAPLKWALHCLTSSMMMTWHHPEVRFQCFARAVLIMTLPLPDPFAFAVPSSNEQLWLGQRVSYLVTLKKSCWLHLRVQVVQLLGEPNYFWILWSDL